MKWDDFLIRTLVFSMAIYSTYVYLDIKAEEKDFRNWVKMAVFKYPKKDVCSSLGIFDDGLRKIVVDYACHEYRERQMQIDIAETPYQFEAMLKDGKK